jgi:hypothetical protein
MESREAKLLKRKYREVEYSDVGPSVKFSCLADEIQNNFPDKDYSSRMLSTIVREAFPTSESRKQHKSRNKFIFGIEAMDVGPSAAPDTDIPLQQQVDTLQTKLSDRDQEVERLRQRVFDLENKLERSQQRVTELEITHGSQIPLPILQQQMTAILDVRHQVCHGPNTVENFHNFSIESVISELQKHTPDVFQLLQQLGTRSDHESEGDTIHDLRPLTAIIALLKNRSVRVLGVQLLLTFTLIARATNKQVYTYYIVVSCIVYILHAHKTIMSTHTMNILYMYVHVGNLNLESCWGVCVLLDRMEVSTATCS